MPPPPLLWPPGEWSSIAPVDPDPTTALITLSDEIVNEPAGVFPKRREVAVLRDLPLILIIDPWPAITGAELNTCAKTGKTTKYCSESFPYKPVLTLTHPLADPAATVATILVSPNSVKGTGTLLPKLTAVVPVKLIPLIVITAPG